MKRLFRHQAQGFSFAMYFFFSFEKYLEKTQARSTLKKTNQYTTQTTCNNYWAHRVTPERELWCSSLFELGHAEPKGKCHCLPCCWSANRWRFVFMLHQPPIQVGNLWTSHPSWTSQHCLACFFSLFFEVFFNGTAKPHERAVPAGGASGGPCQPFCPLASFTSSDFH